MKNYKRLNLIIGLIIGVVACTVYIMTAERSASWWDCGQFLATAFKLQVGHPPGAPTFQLLGNLFTLLVGRDPMLAGFMVNVLSAVASGLSIMFLFWTITILGKKLASKYGEITDTKMWAIFGSGLVGAMAFCFSDAFWFSAVEGEVYALSVFFTAVTFWAILKWDEEADKPHSLRWIILIAYLVGLSIGVHLLNLLVIPAIVFIVYYRKFQPTRKRFWVALATSVVLLGGILWGVIPYIVHFAGRFELLFVNGFGLPFNSGAIFWFALLIGGITWGIHYSIKKGKVILNTALLCLTFLLVGYSTYFIVIIRATAETPLNFGAPKNTFALLDYLNREQYGTRPLVYGSSFTGSALRIEERSPRYTRNYETRRYDRVGANMRVVWDPTHTGLFPRMHAMSNEPGRPNIDFYHFFGRITPRFYTCPRTGEQRQMKPTFAENMRFFIRYHLGWQYMRYFMWNFVGRQNDIPGRGFDVQGNRDVFHGNWISGIRFIDEARLGPQTNLPDFLKYNQGRNTYFFLPLILGLIGLFYQYRKDKNNSFVTFLLFFMTGIAIVIYLNQPSTEPRERDYSVVGSFYAFAIWIGLGVMAIADFLQRKAKLSGKLAAGVATVVTFLAVPTLMAQQNWDDHDRSQLFAARDAARNMLKSTEPNAIIICNGDNDTFPLWFAQNVEGLRPDVRIINSALAGSHWHILPLFNTVYQSAPLNLTLTRADYQQGTNDAVFIQDRNVGRRELIELIRFVGSDNPNTQLTLASGEATNFLPTTQYVLTIDRDDLLARGIITEEQHMFTVTQMEHDIDVGRWNRIHRSDLAFLDILASNNWERPIYVTSPWAQRHIWPITQFAQMEGTLHRFVPFHNPNRGLTNAGANGIATDRTYDLFMNVFTSWGNVNHPRVRICFDTRRTAQNQRHQFGFLAQALIVDGRMEDAVRVLDRALYLFPHRNIDFDPSMIFFVQSYFRTGETQKGLELANKLIGIYERNLLYFESFPPRHRRFLESHIQESLTVFMHLRHLLQGFEEESQELFERLDNLLAIRGFHE
ncbi:MAG: DUF2723 domain-containing protein [Bacteroidales bacterium]|nr:DUF2723 domain-containing protein [Bacteroidales bacterium]